MTTPIENDHTVTSAEFFRLAVLFEGGLLVVAIILAAFIDPSPWARLDLRLESIAVGIAASLPMLTALWFLRNMPTGPIGGLNNVVDDWLVPLVRAHHLGNMLSSPHWPDSVKSCSFAVSYKSGSRRD